MENIENSGINLDQVIRAIYTDQIQNGSIISAFWSELYDQLIIQQGGDVDEGLDENSQTVYNISSEEWFIVGFISGI